MASIAMPRHPPLPVPIDVWHQVTDKQTIVAGRTNFILDPLFPTVPLRTVWMTLHLHVIGIALTYLLVQTLEGADPRSGRCQT
jgi:hypothetical protein